MTIRWQRELPQWILLWGMIALAAFTWDAMPDRLPVHWNLDGEPDRFSGKAEGLLALPAIALVAYVLLLLAPKLTATTLERLGGIYTGVRIGVILMLAVLYGLIVLSVRGYPIDLTRAATVLVGALLEAVGAVMGRMQPNPVMGIRTPWTLASQASWDASQRVGGWLFMGIGGLLMLGGLTGISLLMLAGIVVLLVGAVALVIYGWRICRSDPNRLPPGQTLLMASSQGAEARSPERPVGRRQGPRRKRGRR
jgi:uncharacterized membrane protein